jgi:hypothetical protein
MENMTTTATPMNLKSDVEELVLPPGAWVFCRAKVPVVASGSIRTVTASHIDLVLHQSEGKLRYVIPSITKTGSTTHSLALLLARASMVGMTCWQRR